MYKQIEDRYQIIDLLNRDLVQVKKDIIQINHKIKDKEFLNKDNKIQHRYLKILQHHNKKDFNKKRVLMECNRNKMIQDITIKKDQHNNNLNKINHSRNRDLK